MTFLSMKIEDIINYCKENNEIKWLKEIAETKTTATRYTSRKPKTDENGNIVLNKSGNPIYVVDKTSPKVEVEIPITFVELKTAFCTKFMPELLPKKKDKKPTMFDLIAEL